MSSREASRRASFRACCLRWCEKLRERTRKTTVAVPRPAIMPHVSSSGGGDDLGSEDEVKVFKDEGEEEKRSSENLTEDKSDLIDLTESEVRRISSLTHRQHSNSLPPSYSLLTLHRSFACSFLFSAMFSCTLSDRLSLSTCFYPCRRTDAVN